MSVKPGDRIRIGDTYTKIIFLRAACGIYGLCVPQALLFVRRGAMFYGDGQRERTVVR